MERQEEIRIIERALSLMESNKGHMDGEVVSIPAEYYTSAERAGREQEILFRQFPILVGFSEQLSEPGSFLTHGQSGVSILVTRDDQGGLHAFVNRCRHRGAQLTNDKMGTLRQLVCPYHAWTYDLCGNLRCVTQSASFPGIDHANFGLRRLPVAERYGLVFVVPTSGATLDIDAYLGPILRDLGDFGFNDFVAEAVHETVRPINWKLHMDSTQEAYHIQFLHSRTQGSIEFQATGPHLYQRPHARMVMPHKSLIQYRHAPQNLWHLSQRSALIWTIFPNTTIFFVQDTAQVTSLFPLGADRCQFLSTMLRKRGPLDGDQKSRMEFIHRSFWATMEEDHRVCESIQAAARGGGSTEYLFGTLEFAASAFHSAINDALNGTFTAPGITLAGTTRPM